MNAQMLLANFGYIADAPGGVKRLREAILLLSVQGKLVEQNLHDEPADILLKRIRKNRNNGSARKQYFEPIGQNDRIFSIPGTWAWIRLGEIGEWGSGSTPPRGNNELYGGGITWLKSGELQDNQALIGSQETVSELALKGGSFRRNQAGDVLIAMYGATIGKVAILAEPAVTNQAVCGCTPEGGVSNRYLFNFLVSQRTNFQNASEGGAQPNISKVKIVRYPFPLPPTEEQKRIVAKVDELMALCDKLEAQQQERERRFPVLSRACHARFVEAPSLYNLRAVFDGVGAVSAEDLRKSILYLAIQGKLVNQIPDEGLASDEFTVRNKKGLPPISPDELSFDIPESWVWRRLGLVAETINGDRGKNYPNKREYVTEGIPFINTGHIQPDGSLSAQTMHFISREKFESLRSGKIKDGDLIYCLRGATLGKTAFVDPYKEGAIASSLVIIRLDKNINRRYAFFFLRSPFGRELIRRFDNGSAQPNLAAGSVREYVIPLPPSKEQHRIVAKVDQLMALIDQLEKQQTQKSELAQAFARAAAAAITGTEIQEPEKMKAPKAELVSRLQTKNTPNADDSAPLAKLLTENNGELPAKALWQQSGLDIDAFYQQLRTEMAQGWIVEPEKAVMKEVAAD